MTSPGSGTRSRSMKPITDTASGKSGCSLRVRMTRKCPPSSHSAESDPATVTPGTLPRSMANALRFRALSGRSLTDLAQEGLSMHKSQDLSWAQVAMGANAPMLTKAALVDGNLDAGVLPTGQVVGVIEALPTVASIVETIVHEAERTLSRLGGS